MRSSAHETHSADAAPVPVAIVGAGPYGLSIAAHLKQAGTPFRIFGIPMGTWRFQMPQGMLLKSDGFASSLSDPDGAFTLEAYCHERAIDYHDTMAPVSLELFNAYGLAFQKRFAPHLEEKQVVEIRQTDGQFVLGLEGGERVRASQLVLAVGITHFEKIPSELSHLPASLVSHSSAHCDLSRFCNRKVTVIGAGASALEMAALLHEAGADTTLIARRSEVRFHQKPQERSLWARIRHPRSPLGPGLRSRLFSDAPQLFRLLPGPIRRKIARKHLGPSGGWTIKDRVVGKVQFILGCRILEAKQVDGLLQLNLQDHAGATRQHLTEYAICATGYQADLERLSFLDRKISSKIHAVDGIPVLYQGFETSVRGLYIVGLAAAESFGPMFRFACGADFAARQVTKQLAKRLAQ